MKHDIKTRPVPDTQEEFSIEGLYYPESLEKWFIEFEKELREMLIHNPIENEEFKFNNLIKEILGE